MRPTFEETHELPMGAIREALIAALDAPDAEVRGKVSLRGAEIVVRRGERHFWSPYLSLAFEELGEGVKVYGRFSPHPTVWSGFLASYVICGSIALFSGIFGLAQSQLGQTPVALWVFGAAVFVLGATFTSAFVGQNLGNEQMYTLRHVVDRAFERATEAVTSGEYARRAA